MTMVRNFLKFADKDPLMMADIFVELIKVYKPHVFIFFPAAPGPEASRRPGFQVASPPANQKPGIGVTEGAGPMMAMKL